MNLHRLARAKIRATLTWRRPAESVAPSPGGEAGGQHQTRRHVAHVAGRRRRRRCRRRRRRRRRLRAGRPRLSTAAAVCGERKRKKKRNTTVDSFRRASHHRRSTTPRQSRRVVSAHGSALENTLRSVIGMCKTAIKEAAEEDIYDR